MKKLLLIILLSLMSVQTFAVTETNVNRIFKLEAYRYDAFTKTYNLEQYGSAVYMGNGVVLTNAHVVIGEDKTVLGNYRVCKTTDFHNRPECFSVAKLQYLDAQNDLAYLTIDTTTLKWVTYSKNTVDIGNSVKVYGYPVTWGETITYTEWKISGYDEWMYKVDASLDAGNSGGWVFDGQGKLVGIAVAVKSGYSTLGYVIPLATIKKFQAKQFSTIRTYQAKVNTFSNYEKNLRAIENSKEFQNDYVKIKYFQSLWFTIDDYKINENASLFSIDFRDESKVNYVSVYNVFLTGTLSHSPLDSYYQSMKKSTVTDEDSQKYNKVSKTIFQWHPALITQTQDKDTSGGVTLVVEMAENELLVLDIESDNLTDENYKKALKLAMGGVILQKNISVVPPSFPTLFLTLHWKLADFALEETVDGTRLTCFWDIWIDGPTVQDMDYVPWDTWKSYMTGLYNYFKESLYTNDYEVKQTKSGAYYSYLFGLNNETKKMELDPTMDRYFVIATFVTVNDGMTKETTLTFTFNNKESKAKIDAFLSGLTPTTWKNLPLGWARVWFNTLSKPAFEWKVE